MLIHASWLIYYSAADENHSSSSPAAGILISGQTLALVDLGDPVCLAGTMQLMRPICIQLLLCGSRLQLRSLIKTIGISLAFPSVV